MRQPLDHLRSHKQPVTRTVWIPLDNDAAAELHQAEQELTRLRIAVESRPKDTGLTQRLEEQQETVERLREELRGDPDRMAKFIARSLGRREFEDLQNAHTATPEQRKAAKKDGVGELSWNPDTFPPALIEACCFYATWDDEVGEEALEPLPADFVKEMWDGTDDQGVARWNHAEAMSLFTAAYEANNTRRVVDLGNGSRRTHG